MNIKKNDTVIVLSGKDKGVKGKVLVEGGIVKRETPIRTCKVALYCEKCGKGVRVGYKVEGDKKTRICRKCGAEI